MFGFNLFKKCNFQGYEASRKKVASVAPCFLRICGKNQNINMHASINDELKLKYHLGAGKRKSQILSNRK